jgi:hypothetical protein
MSREQRTQQGSQDQAGQRVPANAAIDEAAPRAGGNARGELAGAWSDMLAMLSAARDAIDDPKLYPPPPTDRNLAEGYRYLLGFMFGAIERALADPAFPYFRRAIQPTDKATIDNADALYLCTPILADGVYRICGRAADHRHWRGEPAATTGRKAPQYVILEATTAYAGDSGALTELSPAVRTNTGTLDSSKLAVAADGSFEILLARERPPQWSGDFIPTVRGEHRATHLVVRELFHDWANEEALELHIERLTSAGAHPPALDPAAAAAALRRIGEIVGNQMRFWNEFYAVLLETYGDMNGDGKRFMPRNDLNAPNFASIATGGGQTTNLYAGGVFELGENDALVIEVETPVPPVYQGFHLSNLWGESLDYANYVTSLNAQQARRDADGHVRFVVAHRDPGCPNWLDTTGLEEGFMALRWTYTTKPDALPTTAVRKVAFDAIFAHLDPATERVTPERRRGEIAVRQAHVQRRYRQY